MSGNVAFADLPQECFPFTVEYIRTDTDDVVHRTVVDAPGHLTVPALAKELGAVIKVRISYATGVVEEHDPQQGEG